MVEDIFKRCNINYEKLEEYGFKKVGNTYIYEKIFLNDFKAIISIDNTIKGKVIDILTNDEYLGLKRTSKGEFTSKVYEEYLNILKDIKDKCFIEKCFIYEQTSRINNYIVNKYKNNPEFLWSDMPGCCIYRNFKNKKWYGIIMNVDISKLESKTGEVEIINLKLPRDMINSLLNKKGFYKAYHMNKKDWITILLNDTLNDDEIFKLIDISYDIINSK